MKNSHRLAMIGALVLSSGAASAGSPKVTRPNQPTVVISSRAPARATTPSHANESDWTRWARAVGQAEDNREIVIAKLRSIKNLKTKLIEALPTQNRAMALDVIAALEMHDLVDELLVYMSADEDGFVTLTISSLMNAKNQNSAINAYLENLKPENANRFSAPTLVAMLEPLGRIGIQLTNSTIEALSKHASADVRSATLYYLRMLAISNHEHGKDQYVQSFLKSTEFQLRLQALSTLTEFSRSRDPAFEPENIIPLDELIAVCKKEVSSVIRGYCLSLVEKPKGER